MFASHIIVPGIASSYSSSSSSQLRPRETSRTLRVLFGIARGAPVVMEPWLYECLSAQRLVDPVQGGFLCPRFRHLPHDHVPQRLFSVIDEASGSSSSSSKSAPPPRPARVQVCRTRNPPARIARALVEAVGGHVLPPNPLEEEQLQREEEGVAGGVGSGGVVRASNRDSTSIYSRRSISRERGGGGGREGATDKEWVEEEEVGSKSGKKTGNNSARVKKGRGSGDTAGNDDDDAAGAAGAVSSWLGEAEWLLFGCQDDAKEWFLTLTEPQQQAAKAPSIGKGVTLSARSPS